MKAGALCCLVLAGAAVAGATEPSGGAPAVVECTPRAGAHHTVSVAYAPPREVPVAGFQVLLDYPETRLVLPGRGRPASDAIAAVLPPGSIAASNDVDDQLEVIVASAGAIPVGTILTVRFERCDGASPPTNDDFVCRVTNATDAFLNPVEGVTCTVDAQRDQSDVRRRGSTASPTALSTSRGH